MGSEVQAERLSAVGFVAVGFCGGFSAASFAAVGTEKVDLEAMGSMEFEAAGLRPRNLRRQTAG